MEDKIRKAIDTLMDGMRAIILAIGSIFLIATSSCSYQASCTICEGCSTVTARVTATDSLLFEQTLCTTRASGKSFTDSVAAIAEAHKSATTTVSRRDTVFNCQFAQPRSKYAAEYEANGWHCDLPK